MQQTTTTPAADIERLALAYVVDAHNVGCLVRLVGERTAQQAHYSAAIQQHGVVIRACHIVVVAPRDDTLEVVWRIGTVGAIERIAEGKVALNLGYRTVTIPYRDVRPEAERAPALGVGDRVLLRGTPIEHAAIEDALRGGELVHPERLRAHVEEVVAHRMPR